MTILPPIDTTGADVIALPVERREPPDGSLMLVPLTSQCRHYHASFEVDKVGGKCKCLSCGAEVSPMFVLEQLMHAESHWRQSRAQYQDEMKRLAERTSTRCRHCGKMTRVSKR